jgi:hypothetical protein
LAINKKWVFQIKRKTNSENYRDHTRLVVKDFFETKGINFHKTFAPIAKLPSIKIILTLVVAHNLEIH